MPRAFRLLHEVWSAGVNDSITEFCLASPEADALRHKIEPAARLVHKVYASSWLDAMNQYHAWSGFEPYKPLEGFSYEAYTLDQLRVQWRARSDDEVLSSQG